MEQAMRIFHPTKDIQTAEAPETAQQMVLAATAFLCDLEPDQRQRAVFNVGDEERLNWDYRPVPRRGLPFSEMDSSQQRRALALLASGLSRGGNITALNIMSLEKVLGDLEGSSGHHARSPDQYFVTIFGDPSNDSAWGWRFEGHHLSVNFLVVDSCKIACSPHFFGANPARVPEGPLQGFRTLPQEEDVARQLLATLNESQLDLAVINETAPSDIITGWEPRVRLDDPVGITVSALEVHQQQVVLQLIGVYLGRMAPQLADNQMDDIDRQGLGSIHFAWAGSKQPGGAHYYRLHGPSFLVEYDNTQNNANHIHSVWRDIRRDWGDDLLREHYARSHNANVHQHPICARSDRRA
jgi:hypothetical protein